MKQTLHPIHSVHHQCQTAGQQAAGTRISQSQQPRLGRFVGYGAQGGHGHRGATRRLRCLRARFNVGRGGDGVHGQHPQRTAGRRPFVALAIARLDDSASRGQRAVALPAPRQVYLK